MKRAANDDPRIALAHAIHLLRERYGARAASIILYDYSLDLQREADKAGEPDPAAGDLRRSPGVRCG